MCNRISSMAAYQSEMKHNLDSLRLVIALFFFAVWWVPTWLYRCKP